MVFDGAGQLESRWAAIVSIASKTGCVPTMLIFTQNCAG
jgi:predicted Co/Zn/Cd cation transporter (cation efflux family)